MIPRDGWVCAAATDGVAGLPEPLSSSGSKLIEGASSIGALDMLPDTCGERTAFGYEFWRGGVPTSGNGVGIVEERRLVGR